MPKETLFLVDDERDLLENWERALSAQGYRCLGFTDGRGALAALDKERPDLILTDLRMPGVDGLELLRCVRGSGIKVPVLLVTAHATLEAAVAAVKEGAFDYIAKPFSNEQLAVAVERGLREKRLLDENRRLRAQVEKMYGLERLIGHSPAIRAVFETIRKVAPTTANVLLQGESGTGKELVARALHLNSKRAAGPFLPVDCASLPETLLEAELFGHERGAYTDAHSAKPGLAEAADGGTLFLDEVGDMPLGVQAKLLRMIQERQVRRLGSNRFVPVDLRIIAATHRDLAALVTEKKFREDLFYRLNVIALTLPPLRDRAGDVEVLARHFLKEFAKSNGRTIEGFAPGALEALELYKWPGNVRELQNVIERGVALADTALVSMADLPAAIRASGTMKKEAGS